MIGIYKITSPSGKIYVGQSVNIEKRFRQYESMTNMKSQTRLVRSFKKYGSKNHVFGIIEECKLSELNQRERYWQEHYNVIGSNGLNCRLTGNSDRSGFFSKESRLKMSEKLKGNKRNVGRVMPNEVKEKISKAKIGKYKGIPKSESHKAKIGLNQKGGLNHQAKIVLCLNTGIFYDTVLEAANAYNLNRYTLSDKLNNRRGIKNKTSLIFA